MSVKHTHTHTHTRRHPNPLRPPSSDLCIQSNFTHTHTHTHTKAGLDAVHELLDQRKFDGQGVMDLRGALALFTYR